MNKKIDLKVGYLCNNDCIHCAIRQTRESLIGQKIETELTTNQLKALIDQYCCEYDKVTITGGEPTIRKDFLDIIQYASNRFKFVELQTNGRRLANKKILDVLANLNNVVYTIALHGTTSDVHDCVTRRKHSFDQTIRGIRAITKLPNKPNVTIKFVLTNYNKNDVVSVVQLAKRLECSQINIAYVHGCTNDHEMLELMLPSFQQLKILINQAIQVGNQLGIDVTVESFPLCVIDTCHYQNVDDLKLKTIYVDVVPVSENKYNWNKERAETNKLKKNQCNNCCLQNNCEGPWTEYWDVHNGEGLIPLFPNKPPIPFIKECAGDKLAGYLKILKEYY